MEKMVLEASVREELLKNMWLLHDSRWFINVISEFGIDVANRLNLQINKSIGKTEIRLLLNKLNYGKIDNIKKLKGIFDTAVSLYLPDYHHFEFEVYDDTTLLGKVIKCCVYSHLEKAGTTSIYKCPSKVRCDSWLEACGLNGESFADKTAQDCNGNCTVTYRINWD